MFCDVSERIIKQDSRYILPVVKRGQCSFETKIKTAAKIGYLAMLLVNNDDSIFPPGGSENFTFPLPIFMVGSSFLDAAPKTCSGVCKKSAVIIYGNYLLI